MASARALFSVDEVFPPIGSSGSENTWTAINSASFGSLEKAKGLGVTTFGTLRFTLMPFVGSGGTADFLTVTGLAPGLTAVIAAHTFRGANDHICNGIKKSA